MSFSPCLFLFCCLPAIRPRWEIGKNAKSGGSAVAALSFLACFSAGLALLLSPLAPMQLLWLFQASIVPIIVVSKVRSISRTLSLSLVFSSLFIPFKTAEWNRNVKRAERNRLASTRSVSLVVMKNNTSESPGLVSQWRVGGRGGCGGGEETKRAISFPFCFGAEGNEKRRRPANWWPQRSNLTRYLFRHVTVTKKPKAYSTVASRPASSVTYPLHF